MSDVALHASRPEELRAHREEIVGLASAHGMSGLRLTDEGRLLTRLDGERTYVDVAEFELAVEDATGLIIEVVPDGVLRNPGHPRDLDVASPL